MAFIKETLLLNKYKEAYKEAKGYIPSIDESIDILKIREGITVFLSHSHKDKKLAIGFIKLLEDLGFKVYVDWNDSSMPRITSAETARKIKERIRQMHLFIFLATKNGIKSRWCPWELGVADSLKDWDDILIVPVVDKHGNFKGNEYLQIYRHLTLDIRFLTKGLIKYHPAKGIPVIYIATHKLSKTEYPTTLKYIRYIVSNPPPEKFSIPLTIYLMQRTMKRI